VGFPDRYTNEEKVVMLLDEICRQLEILDDHTHEIT
jgi:hypothetical protein